MITNIDNTQNFIYPLPLMSYKNSPLTWCTLIKRFANVSYFYNDDLALRHHYSS